MLKNNHKRKIIFNEITKEIVIQEDNGRLRKWLEKNKIYFETLMTISLTIMGIVVSIISLSLEKRSIEIQKRELDIIYSSYLPVFNVTTIDHKTDYVIDGVRYSPSIEYIIKNNGGNIHDAYLSTESKIYITLFNSITNEKINISINNLQRFLKSYSYYNADTKSFTVQREYANRYIELLYFLSKELNDTYQGYIVNIYAIDYINIQYYDFENSFKNDWYELNGGELLVRSPSISNIELSLSIASMTNEEIYEAIVEKLDEIILGK